LFSNTNILFDEYKDTLAVMKYLDGSYIFAKTKLIKPNREIYVAVLEVFYLQAFSS
jgi:FMN phosphatase YigB (HAD superfamily)